MSRAVTEEDFRMPEFRGKDPADYEFRSDGKVVRKDRWEQGIHSIRSALGDGRREFEISEVILLIRGLVDVLPDIEDTFGHTEGDVCGRGGCSGVIKRNKVENCSCHINPPCGACLNAGVSYPGCGWDSEAQK